MMKKHSNKSTVYGHGQDFELLHLSIHVFLFFLGMKIFKLKVPSLKKNDSLQQC